MLIGLGAAVSELGEMLPGELCTVFVIDRHARRCVSLDNVYATNDVVLLDGTLHELLEDGTVRQAYAYLASVDSDIDENYDDEDARDEMRQRAGAETVLRQYYTAAALVTANSEAMVMYQMAQQVNKHSNDLLWWAVVGSTECDADVQQMLQSEVLRFNQRLASGRLSALMDVAAQNADDHSIVWRTKCLALPLYRHQSLYQSLAQCPQVCAKFGLWRESGRKRLDNYIVQLGISRNEVHSMWGTYAGVAMDELERRIDDKSVVFRMSADMLWHGDYMRRFGYRQVICSRDAVLALQALMTLSNDGAQGGFAALDALSDCTLMMHGVERAKAMQRQVVTTGMHLIEDKQVKPLRNYRMCILKDTTPQQAPGGPMALFRSV